MIFLFDFQSNFILYDNQLKNQFKVTSLVIDTLIYDIWRVAVNIKNNIIFSINLKLSNIVIILMFYTLF